MKKWIFVLTAFLFPTLSHAYDVQFEFAIIPSSLYSEFQTGDMHWDTIVTFCMHIIQLLITMAGIFAVILIMIGGFRIVIGSTNMIEEEGGKTSIKNTIIGFVVILFSWIMVDFTIAFLTSGS